MNRLQRSSVNMLSSVAGYSVPMLVSFITTPLLLRALGEAAFGLQSLVAVIVGYLMFMDMGLDLPIIKFLAEDRARQDAKSENRLLSTTLQLYAGIGLAGMVVIMLLADWFARSVFKVPDDLVGQAVIVFRLAGIGFLGSVGMSWGRAAAMGVQRFDLSYSVSVVLSTAGTLIGLGVVYAGYGVVGYVLIRVIFTALAGPIYFILTRHLLPSFRFVLGVDCATLRRVRGYVGYGTFNRITSSLVSRLDQTLLGVWVGVAAAGIYSVPFMLMTSLGYILAYMLGFIFPMASELQSLGQIDRLRDIFIRSSQFIVALAGLVFIPLFVLGDLFLTLWTPTISAKAAGVLQLLALAGYIGTLTTTLPNNMMVGLGKMRQFTIYATIRAVALAAFCFIFIRPLGIEGAGWALLFTCSVDVIYFVIFLRRYIQISPSLLLQKAYLKPVLLGVAFAALTFLCRPFAISWIGFGAVGIGLLVIYIKVGFIVGVFGESEKRATMILYNLVMNKITSQA
ncbi:MAG: oligosaccharide flippase family protein [Candidatus Omnitrophota bacterium]|jgi:O-antigen/teichoic acid export membrane protein